jgi:hypothetical protein
MAKVVDPPEEHNEVRVRRQLAELSIVYYSEHKGCSGGWFGSRRTWRTLWYEFAAQRHCQS